MDVAGRRLASSLSYLGTSGALCASCAHFTAKRMTCWPSPDPDRGRSFVLSFADQYITIEHMCSKGP